jgi:two-component system, OmpR family, response regulator
MPKPDGFETTHALPHGLRTGGILIIAFTALDEAEVLTHGSHAMFDGYCQKGQPPAVLIALIEHFTS